MKHIKVLLLVSILLAGCSQPKAEALPTYTPYPTLAPLPTYTLYPTLEPLPTYIPYPTLVKPTNVPTATVPAITATPEPTVNPDLTSDKKEGVYLIGSEVAPGQWRGSGDCGIQIYDKTGMLLDAVTQKRSILNVPATAYRVEFWAYEAGCTWSYLGQ